MNKITTQCDFKNYEIIGSTSSIGSNIPCRFTPFCENVDKECNKCSNDELAQSNCLDFKIWTKKLMPNNGLVRKKEVDNI